MTKTTIIDLIATRLPDDADAYPDWTIRCTWVGDGGGDDDGCTFHAAPNEYSARGLARFILDRYQDLDTRKLKGAEIHRPDGTWENVPRPTGGVTAPVRFAFQRMPRRPA